jgi:hypothetical protein
MSDIALTSVNGAQVDVCRAAMTSENVGTPLAGSSLRRKKGKCSMSVSGISPMQPALPPQTVNVKTPSGPAPKPTAPPPSAGTDSDGDHDGSGGLSVKA